ncbi:acyl-CoA dehydrogenase family protein, partial [Aquisalimonas sp.]|uniref:acyl-CoA dehydrogenase family protein n=1 Tax=Aquisalimonas sp. TaxID=1872621 RepID=UPI0025C00F4C
MTAHQMKITATQMEGSMSAHLLDRVERLRPVLEANAPKADAERKLPQVVFDSMYDAGLFAMLAPRAYGGFELPPSEAMRVWEAVARIDAAAAWNLVMNQGFACAAAWLPEDGAQELLGDGPTTIAGPFFPPGSARRVDGGWQVTSRGPYASGCHNARWFWLSALETQGGEPVVDPDSGDPIAYGFFIPREEAEIFDTWHTLGMRGTGSADIGVADVFVPDRRAMRMGPLQAPAPGFEGPLYRMWPLSAVLGETTVSIGIAAAAVDAIVDLVKVKTPAFSATALRDQAVAQHAVGRAAGKVNASRDTLHAAAREAYEETKAGGELLSWDAKIRLQLAVNFAAESCAEAVRLVHAVAGASAIRLEYPFERLFRDIHTL